MHRELHAHSEHVGKKETGLASIIRVLRACRRQFLFSSLSSLSSLSLPLPPLRQLARGLRVVRLLVNTLQSSYLRWEGVLDNTSPHAARQYETQELTPPVFARHCYSFK